MKIIQIVASSVAIQLAAMTALALTPAEERAIKLRISLAPTAELPAQALDLINKAAKQDREAVAVIALRGVMEKSPAAAPVVVVAMSKAAPQLKDQLARTVAEYRSKAPDAHPPYIGLPSLDRNGPTGQSNSHGHENDHGNDDDHGNGGNGNGNGNGNGHGNGDDHGHHGDGNHGHGNGNGGPIDYTRPRSQY